MVQRAYLSILHAFLNINCEKISLPFIFDILTLLTDLEKKIENVIKLKSNLILLELAQLWTFELTGGQYTLTTTLLINN
jgi:hypothetical protein